MTLTSARVFVGLLWAVGLATALVLARAPQLLLPVPMPFFLVPLGAGLLTELVLRAVPGFAGDPVRPGARALGVGGAALIAVLGAAMAPR